VGEIKMDNDKAKTIIKETAIFYKEQKIKAHVVLSNKTYTPSNGYGKNDENEMLNPIRPEKFYNGLIVDVKENMLVIDDLKFGITPIHMEEVFRIEKFREYTEEVPKSFYQQ
jgi:hypothetical protein